MYSVSSNQIFKIAALCLGIIFASAASAAGNINERRTVDYVAMEYFSNAWILISKEDIEETPREVGLSALRSAFLIFVSRNGLKNASTNTVDAGYLTAIHRFVSAATVQEIDDYVKDLYLSEHGKTTIDGKVMPRDELAQFYQDFLQMRAMPEEDVAQARRSAMEHARSEKKSQETQVQERSATEEIK